MLSLILFLLSSPITLSNVPSAIQQGKLPNRAISPGDTITSDTVRICKRGYAGTVRAVSDSAKRHTYERYGIVASNLYVIDHIIPLEIGGSNTGPNLFPQKKPYDRQKDSLENRLRTLVCSGRYAIKNAQKRIATNWYREWLRVKKLPK